MAAASKPSRLSYRLSRARVSYVDVIAVAFAALLTLAILVPFINVIAVSFASQTAYYNNRFMLFPPEFTLSNYKELFKDNRILTGYRTSGTLALLGVPLNMFLTVSLAYGTSRPAYPGKKLIMFIVLFTMFFSGGIIPLYLLIKGMRLTDTLASVILCTGLGTFNMILVRNYFYALPDSLMESAKLDGAGEWRILLRIALPLSLPILATVSLFYLVDRWNEWYLAMIFIRSTKKTTLQLVLRSIMLVNQMTNAIQSATAIDQLQRFDIGVRMGAIVVTILPVMCVFPFLQKHFAKGVMVGAIKT
ncbi:MAG: carbohydrate ABC transporter permease [Oscillospiraceae bacterium]|jgi:putative aldouronate transport system permease protein|nr:carbohydrate ABC transporter permease [Oscillospiraceae bacterium]